MALLSLALVWVPFIPGLRSLPSHLRVYRPIWRDSYREAERPAATAQAADRQLMPNKEARREW